ncbi:MAG: hypothetical protein RL134_1851 [Actinomycetota bacterium]|jgi:hypothetical protein
MSGTTGDTWSEGADGERLIYRERLYPPLPVFLLAAGLATIMGVAYGAAYGAAWGWAMGITLGLVGVAALIATSTRVHVDDRVLRAGRARLPLTVIAGATPLDADAMRRNRRHGDPRDYIVLRAWSARTGVAVDVCDPRDPHPRWIITSRHPQRLAEAIRRSATQPQPNRTDG